MHGRTGRGAPLPATSAWGEEPMVDEDAVHMRRALELAERGWGRVSPNPMVGAVVLRDGETVGEGWHEGPGTDHAEVMALRDAGDRARGATLVCTLEPCNHFGRTPPCTRALIDAGVAHVIVAANDPNLEGDAPGLNELRQAGIDVEAGPLAAEAQRLNEAFERHVATGLPFVVLKMAASLDGKAAASDGTSRWISGEPARADVQRLRAWSDAVLVGAGTAIADDPALTVRDPRLADATPPLRVVADATGRLPTTGRLFDGEAPLLVATTEAAPRERIRAWAEAGAEVLTLDPDPAGGVSLAALMHALGKRDVQGALVEGGPTLAWSLVRDRLVDKVVTYVGPVIVGGTAAPGIVGGTGFAPLADAPRLGFTSVERIGADVRMEAYVHRDR
jgi:diaminohydroxyphosphoribosylaminopyrimidine deaminase/5-amino-6-(5-phosphoribosylamino)uracil reductase